MDFDEVQRIICIPNNLITTLWGFSVSVFNLIALIFFTGKKVD